MTRTALLLAMAAGATTVSVFTVAAATTGRHVTTRRVSTEPAAASTHRVPTKPVAVHGTATGRIATGPATTTAHRVPTEPITAVHAGGALQQKRPASVNEVPQPRTSSVTPAVTQTPALSPSCASAIATVTARGLSPAPGFVVICPGYALGHEGMTCVNYRGVCPGIKEIVISDPVPYVVANEFENSRTLTGAAARCHEIDCGQTAYGF